MNKRTITILSLVGIVLLIIAFVGFGSVFATQLRSCQRSIPGCISSASRAADIGFVLYLAGVIPVLVGWIMGLMKTAQIRRWGWFVAVLLTIPVGSLLYGIAGPTTRAKA